MRLVRLLLLASVAISAQDSPPAATPSKFVTATFNGLKLRSIGPAVASGRVIAFAVHPQNRAHYYAAVASGGVWKTVNGGTTWTPVFENEGSYSIGAITLDPKNPSTVWVGTGEANAQRSVSYGDGVYRSDDGGKSWKNLGLKQSEHIGRIVIDPRDSNVVYVAAQGPLWAAGGDRGLYKTADSGKTWKKILEIGEHTGVTDIVIDPQDSNILVAASWQRRRHFFTYIGGGPESAIHRSTDGGATWTKMKPGLPTEDMGRVTFAATPANPRLLYASIDAANKTGGVFASTDFGASWEKRSSREIAAMYFGRIFADPVNADRVYLTELRISESLDGGRTWKLVPGRHKHVDSHAIWQDLQQPDYMLVGCDGGIYETFDRGANWAFKANLPITQFYDVEVEQGTSFYSVYGGTQDNATLGGPARTRSSTGIVNSDWFVTVFGDGFQTRIDPQDPNIIYSEFQYGGVVRYDKRTGERTGIQPREGKGDAAHRWNWDAPLLISPHSNTRLYFGAQRLYRSDDRGDTWKAVSPDLSRALDRDKLPVMGRLWGPDAVARHTSTAAYGNLTVVVESPKKEGLLAAGTDDGLIHVSENGGLDWKKIDGMPGAPKDGYITRILPSQANASVMYATLSNHQNGDFKPYVFKSSDTGRTWTSISGDLPANGPVWAIAEDHVNPNLLFVGTEYGLFFSVEGGQKWVRLKGGLPTIAVRDLGIQRKENDLVVATFGRGFYVLDNYAPLRELKADTLAQEGVLLSTRDALLYVESNVFGTRAKGFQGEAYYAAENPAFGATFTYYLNEAVKTRAQRRRDAEKKAIEKKTDFPIATLDDVRGEAEEEAPAILLAVTDSAGRVIRTLTGANTAGTQRASWDLRDPAITLPPAATFEGEVFSPQPTGALVTPGVYKVQLFKRVAGVVAPLGAAQSFNVGAYGSSPLITQDRKGLQDFQRKAAALQRAVAAALESANTTKTRLGEMSRAADQAQSADGSFRTEVRALDKRINDILKSLRGDSVLREKQVPQPPSISERSGSLVQRSQSKPTQTATESYNIAAEEFETVLAKLRQLVETDVRNLERKLDVAGAPHTSGRLPEWKRVK